MARHIKDILTEWFYRLPNGYAIKPYNQKELQVLEQILQEKGIEPDSIIHSLQENDSQLDQAFNNPDPLGDGFGSTCSSINIFNNESQHIK